MNRLSAKEVYELHSHLARYGHQMGVQQIQSISAVLDFYKPELLMRPSAKPGVPEHPGCSPKQRVVYDAILNALTNNSYQRVAAWGANRSGKTKGIIGAIVTYLRDHAKSGGVGWCISPTYERSVDGAQRELWNTLPRSMFGPKQQWSPKLGFGTIDTLQLILPDARGTFEVWFKYEDQKLKTFEQSMVRWIWWNEAEREALLDAMSVRFVGASGKLFMDYVARFAWQRKRIRTSTSKRHFQIKFWMKDNEHNMAPGEIEDARTTLSAQEAAIRIDGEEGQAFGSVYPQFRPGIRPDYGPHQCKPFRLPKAWPRYRCMDYGFRNPNATLWAAMAPREFIIPGRPELPRVERLIIYREHYTVTQTVAQNAEQIIAMSGNSTERIEDPGDPRGYRLSEVFESERYRFDGLVTVDPTIYARNQEDGRTIAYHFWRHGLACRPGVRSASVREHGLVTDVRLWFEADMVMFFDTCEMAVYEHEVWRHKQNTDGLAPGSEPFEDKDNHTCDALKELIAERPTFSAPTIRVNDFAIDHDEDDD